MDKVKLPIRIIAAALMLIITVALTAALLFGCVGDSGGGYTQEDGVTEPDKIIVTTDGYIVKLQRDGMTAVKTDNGQLTLAKSKKAPELQTPIDLIGHGDYIISIVSYGRSHTLVSVYNASELNDGTNRIEPVRETVFAGDYYTCRIYDGTLYFIAKSSTVYKQYNSETNKVEETGNTDRIYDSYERSKEFAAAGGQSGSTYSGYLLASLPLSAPETSLYTLKSYRAENLSTLYFSRYAMYLAFNTYRGSCGGEPVSYVEKLTLDGFAAAGKSEEMTGHIPSRYCMSDNGEYLCVVTSDGYTNLYTLDGGMKQALSRQGIAGDMSSCYFSDGFCYIETSGSTLKIDVSNPVSPVVLGNSKINSQDGFMLQYGEGFSLGVAVSSGKLTVNFYQTDNDELYHINTVTTTLPSEYSAALDRRGILVISESNAVAVCTDSGVYVYGIDIYGYLEYKLTLGCYNADVTETSQAIYRIYRVAVIDGYIYTVSDGAVISYGMDYKEIDVLITLL